MSKRQPTLEEINLKFKEHFEEYVQTMAASPYSLEAIFMEMRLDIFALPLPVVQRIAYVRNTTPGSDVGLGTTVGNTGRTRSPAEDMKASKTKFVGVWIDAEMYQALIAEMHADPKSRSLSDTVRACLKHHLFGDDGTILKEFVPRGERDRRHRATTCEGQRTGD